MHVFWGMKELVQLKFVQLLLLNRVKGKMIKKPCCLRFLLDKFVQLKYFSTQFKNVHLQVPCSLRPCISRPYCNANSKRLILHCVAHPKVFSSGFVCCCIRHYLSNFNELKLKLIVVSFFQCHFLNKTD